MAKLKKFRGAFWKADDKKQYAYQGELDLNGKKYLGFLYINDKHEEGNKQPILKLSAIRPKKS